MRQAIPHFQPVIFAVTLGHQQGVVLQVKGFECEGDLGLGRGDDDVGAFQVVGVLVGEVRRLDHTGGSAEVPETVL